MKLDPIAIKPPLFTGKYCPYDVKVEGPLEGLTTHRDLDKDVEVVTCSKCHGRAEISHKAQVEGGTYTVIHRCETTEKED